MSFLSLVLKFPEYTIYNVAFAILMYVVLSDVFQPVDSSHSHHSPNSSPNSSVSSSSNGILNKSTGPLSEVDAHSVCKPDVHQLMIVLYRCVRTMCTYMWIGLWISRAER